jgi:cytochrome c-type biogenesis protein
VIAALPSSLLAAIPVAIAAGFISFASPCVLPLVPGYVAFVGGAIGDTVPARRTRVLRGACAFIMGFTTVFVSEGALFGEIGSRLRADQRALSIGFGIVVILLGLFFAGWLPAKWLNRDLRWHHLPTVTVFGAYLLGLLFAIGWSPCLGPTLAAITSIELSTKGATALRGSILAFTYCWGLGVPFLVLAFAGERAQRSSAWLKRHAKWIGRLGGVLLIIIGVAEVTGWWQQWVIWLKDEFPQFNLPL